MKRFSPAAIPMGALAAALAPAGAAAAAPAAGSAADETVNSLQAEGFNVVINGIQEGPLSDCRVTAIHGLRDSNVSAAGRIIDPSQFTTVYVDISCPSRTT